MVHTCNPSYPGDEIQRMVVRDQPEEKKKISKTPSPPTSWAWWFVSVTPAV
jgi:hypothetical protein